MLATKIKTSFQFLDEIITVFVENIDEKYADVVYVSNNNKYNITITLPNKNKIFNVVYLVNKNIIRGKNIIPHDMLRYVKGAFVNYWLENEGIILNYAKPKKRKR